MSLSVNTLQSLQQAGQCIYDCRERLKAEVSRHTERLVSVMANQPTGPTVDGVFAQVKQVARLHQELQALEDQLRHIYQTAEQIKGDEIEVIDALPHRRVSGSSAPPATEDARMVVSPVAKKVKKARPSREIPSQTDVSHRPGRVSANDEKVYRALRRLLKTHKGEQLSQSQIAREAGIPVGSIGVSIKRLVRVGRISHNQRGAYHIV